MFKNNIKTIREAQGLNQTALASKTGIAQGTISAFESGKLYCWPKARRKIAKVLGKTEVEIFPNGEMA